MKKVIPDGESLLPFQKDTVRRVVESRIPRWLLALDMGLGKSVVTAVILNAWYVGKKTLIICPPVLRLNLFRELTKWIVEDLKIEIVFKIADVKTSRIKNADIVIISDAIINRKEVLAFILTTDFDTVVYDEAHRIKSYKSGRNKAFFKIIKDIHKCLLLTGTPMVNSVMDLHPLFSICQPNRWGKRFDFGKEYSTPVNNGYAIEFKGVRNVAKLKSRYKVFTERVIKEDVLKELPDKIISLVEVELSNSSIGERSLALERFAMKACECVSHKVSEDAVYSDEDHIMVLRRELGLSKVDAVCDFLDQFEKEQVVVFAHHKQVIDLIIVHLADNNKTACSITGSTTAAEKDQHIAGFQNGDYQFIVCNTLAGGVGITLTASSTCVFAELDWTPANMSQAMDRLHRIGQKDSVNCYWLVGSKSLDQRIAGIIREKALNINKTIGER